MMDQATIDALYDEECEIWVPNSKERVEQLVDFARKHGGVLSEESARLADSYGVSIEGLEIALPVDGSAG